MVGWFSFWMKFRVANKGKRIVAMANVHFRKKWVTKDVLRTLDFVKSNINSFE